MVVSSKIEITKSDMKKLLFIFLGIFLILIASYASAQSTPNNIPSTEGIKEELSAVKKEIEIIKQSVEKLKENTKQNISIEKRLGAVEDNLKEMSSPTENMILKIAKENVNAAKNYHDSIRTIINVFWCIFWIIVVGLTILISSLKLNIPLPREWAGKILDNLVSEPLLRMKEKERIRTLKNLNAEGLLHYNKSEGLEINQRKVFIGLAIEYTESALLIAKEVFNLEPRNREEEIDLCRIYTNLTYYYSYIQDKFTKAYECAKNSLRYVFKYEGDAKLFKSRLNWIDNFLFFCKQFFDKISQEDKKLAQKFFNNYKDLLLSVGICNKEEIEQYGKIFSTI